MKLTIISETSDTQNLISDATPIRPEDLAGIEEAGKLYSGEYHLFVKPSEVRHLPDLPVRLYLNIHPDVPGAARAVFKTYNDLNLIGMSPDTRRSLVDVLEKAAEGHPFYLGPALYVYESSMRAQSMADACGSVAVTKMKDLKTLYEQLEKGESVFVSSKSMSIGFSIKQNGVRIFVDPEVDPVYKMQAEARVHRAQRPVQVTILDPFKNLPSFDERFGRKAAREGDRNP